MSKFIPIEWVAPRNDMYVNIDCYEKDEKGKEHFKPSCCSKVILGCDISLCGCDPALGMRIQVLDQAGTIVAESKHLDAVNKIYVEKDELGAISIRIE